MQHSDMFFEIIHQIQQKSKETFCFEIKIEILNELIFVLECYRDNFHVAIRLHCSLWWIPFAVEIQVASCIKLRTVIIET